MVSLVAIDIWMTLKFHVANPSTPKAIHNISFIHLLVIPSLEVQIDQNNLQ
jgi:hypothetical protein